MLRDFFKKTTRKLKNNKSGMTYFLILIQLTNQILLKVVSFQFDI